MSRKRKDYTMTNIDKDGNYPLSDDLYGVLDRKEVNAEFEKIWKEYLKLLPEVPVECSGAEVFKSFAIKVFGESIRIARGDVDGKYERLQGVVNDAYYDGMEDGQKVMKKAIKEELIKAIEKYELS
jgi:hypothetical protein